MKLSKLILAVIILSSSLSAQVSTLSITSTYTSTQYSSYKVGSKKMYRWIYSAIAGVKDTARIYIDSLGNKIAWGRCDTCFVNSYPEKERATLRMMNWRTWYAEKEMRDWELKYYKLQTEYTNTVNHHNKLYDEIVAIEKREIAVNKELVDDYNNLQNKYNELVKKYNLLLNYTSNIIKDKK